jgi:hypothetical protein
VAGQEPTGRPAKATGLPYCGRDGGHHGADGAGHVATTKERTLRSWSVALLATTGLLIAAVPHAGDHPDPGDLAERLPAGSAVTLSEPAPDWYDAELHERVLDAAPDGAGVALPEGADVPASALAFTGIRPGSWMLFPAGCTLNFVFGSAPSDGGGSGTYIGTAGHCTEVGDEVTIVAAPGILMNIGTTVRSVDEGVGDDFALIEIREEMVQHVNPSTAYFGGPTATGDPQLGDVVAHAGHGVGIGTGGTPRAGLVVYRGEGDTNRSDAFAWNGAAAPGDSGSFVVDVDGMTAAGNLTHLVVGGPYVPGNTAGTSIDRMLEIAGQPLVTAPAGPDPTS